jgi:hypothetical protein
MNTPDETAIARAWNFYHPEAPRPVPPRVGRETVPARADALDALLAIYILQARLE